MADRQVRVGIDVGGTHTKAVAIDNDTHEIIGKAGVFTTHDHELGVAEGIVQCFHKCLDENGIRPEEVIFIAHSTTQATNALLEGDVAKVGVLGIGKGGLEGVLVKKQSRIDDIPLGTGKFIHTAHDYTKIKHMNQSTVEAAINRLKGQGAAVIVASKAFGVDGGNEEEMVKEISQGLGLPCTAASDISKLYGLTVRTRTAAINASILPKMLDTASRTEESVRRAGIKVPLMMMRGDGGVMEVEEMKKRPVLTMLSGPAASVVGSLMYLRASNGVYFEVGGTSTNIGVIKNGRPTVDYSVVGGHKTYISSLDVRVLGVAGGSMVRVSGGKIVDVGPRSAHIAGLPYAAFTDPADIDGARVEFVQPKQDDPDDYVAIQGANGTRVAITNTCAANVLGLVDSAYYAYGNQESCRKAMQPLADMLNVSVEDAARQILDKAAEKIVTVIDQLAALYRLESDQMVLVGVGGGAASLLPFTADRMKLKYQIPENAEVISSIGVALAMVRDVVERVIPNASTSDIAQIKREAADRAISNGAVPETVEVHIEIDAQTQKVTAIATGSTEVKTTDLRKECTEEEARGIAAESMGVDASNTELEAAGSGFYVFSKTGSGPKNLRIIDKKGFVKIQRRDALVQTTKVGDFEGVFTKLWDACMTYQSDIMISPDMFVIMGARLLDYSGISTVEQIQKVLATEMIDVDGSTEIILVGGKNGF